MLDNKHLFNYGLCNWALDLQGSQIITPDEFLELKYYIKNNKPFSLYRLFNDDNYYWKPMDIKPREKWLKHHISIN